MLLQNDKPTITLSRERANRILYDAEPMIPANFPAPETNHLFNNNHDLGEYNRLVNNEYSDKINEPVYMEPMAQYHTEEPIRRQAYQEVQLEKYYNDANPVPQSYHQAMHQSYRTKVLTDFPDFKVETILPAASVDEAEMEKVAETEVIEAAVPVDLSAYEDTSTTESYLRLNVKGLIACVTFAAVTALIIALVVINSIAIGTGGAQIERLKAENSELTADYNQAMLERENAYLNGRNEAMQSGGTAPDTVTLPPINSYELAPETSDYSTNLFDQICKFLSNLFG